MCSNKFPQQQSMGQMPPQMAPMQQQDQQTGFAGMYAPQYGANAPMAGGMAMANGNMQGYGGGQVAQGYEQSMPPAQSYEIPQAVPNYQVPQVQQQAVVGYGGYIQQPMQQNPYGNQKQSSRQGPQRLY